MTQVENIRLLLVDDDPDVIKAHKAIFLRRGWTVDTATNGVDAIARVMDTAFDVIITDISMPEMDGVVFLRVVSEHDLDVPVIMLTGEPTVSSAAQAVEYGAYRYLIKPVMPDVLVKTATRAVQLHRISKLKKEAQELAKTDPQLVDRAELELHYSQGLNLLWMAFQPIIEWSTKRIYGYEALLRSDEPTMRSPLDMLSAAETLGCIHQLGQAVRNKVAKVIEETNMVGVKLFVNLHSMDLNDEHLYAESSPLSQIAKRTVLEVTERASLHDVRDVNTAVSKLRGLGYQLAVDDLGAGYAGLTSFTQLEPEIAKFDMSLVRGVDKDPRRQRIIRSMKTLCDELGILVICEGIETFAERDKLVELGCDLFQGYLFARPSHSFELPRW